MTNHNHWGSSARLFIVTGLALACGACADLTAVQNFAKMAPNPSVIQGLTKAYAGELDTREDVKLLGDDAPNPLLAQNDKIRAQQAIAIQGLDTAIREYMQALGALAGNDIVQSSGNVKDVTTGLASLQKSIPSLGLTSSQVGIIGQFIQSVADLAENGYRNAKLANIIKTSDGPFQQLITIQTQIVSKAIKPSIAEIQRSLNENSEVATFMNDDISYWTHAAVAAEKRPAAAVRSDHMTTFRKRNPTYGEPGAADAHAARYLLRNSLEADQTALTAQTAAADAYVKALNSIGKAHTALLLQGNHVLTKATISQIKPMAQEVYKDYQDIRSLELSNTKR